jgi:hypothetical protein
MAGQDTDADSHDQGREHHEAAWPAQFQHPATIFYEPKYNVQVFVPSELFRDFHLVIFFKIKLLIYFYS